MGRQKMWIRSRVVKVHYEHRKGSLMTVVSRSILFCCVSASLAVAEDVENNWHQWRGPHANGSSLTADPPTKWSATKNVAWKVAVPGKGSGSPVIWGDRIYVTTATKSDRTQPAIEKSVAAPAAAEPKIQGGRSRVSSMLNPVPTNFYRFSVHCFDRHTGKSIWDKTVTEAVPHEPGHTTNSYASASPIVDGKNIFVSFGSFGIFCLDMDGNEVWKRDLGRMATRNTFGEGGTPALHQDTLVVPWDHEGQSFITGLDTRTGATRWKTDREEPSTWATPLIVEAQGRTQVVTNGLRVRSYDLATGKLLWECGGQVVNPIPSPVVHENLVVCMTGYQGNSIYAIPLNSTGDVTESTTIAWQRHDAAPYVPSPTLYRGQLYFTKSNVGIMSSLDASTGEVFIGQTRLEGIASMYASPVAAADRIYFTSRDGVTCVVKHGRTLEVLATNDLGEPVDASPALVGRDLYLRSSSHLYCIREGGD